MRKGMLWTFWAMMALVMMSCPDPVDGPASNANLSGITLSTGTLSPAFDPGTLDYMVGVPNNVDSITVTGTKADSNATISSNNGVAQSLDVVGLNAITLVVTAEDGATVENYTVRIFRAGEQDHNSPNIGTLVYVPAGSFQRDATPSNISIITQPYRMSQHQIPRAQWRAIFGDDHDPSYVTRSTSLNDPVQWVNWYHAIAFANKLSLAEGLTPVYSVVGIDDWEALGYVDIPVWGSSDLAELDIWNAATANWDANGYRLPTEMEWMWAAMGADQDSTADWASGVNTTGYSKPFAGFNGSNNLGDYAVYQENSGPGDTNEEERTTRPVGSKLPNELGLYDMSGNVNEWNWDWSAHYPTGTLTDYRGAALVAYRVNRGGNWINSSGCAVASRNNSSPSSRNVRFGIRVVRP